MAQLFHLDLTLAVLGKAGSQVPAHRTTPNETVQSSSVTMGAGGEEQSVKHCILYSWVCILRRNSWG